MLVPPPPHFGGAVEKAVDLLDPFKFLSVFLFNLFPV